ncbi:MAG: hypothetical protein WDO14_00985 [Bacteroidota bacterium]
MGLRLSILVLVLISCGQRKLTIGDLKFPDPERKGIVRNGVKEMMGVPSMQISSADTTLHNIYDKIGRSVTISPYPGDKMFYRYDSMSLPDSLTVVDWDVYMHYKIIPTFDEETTVLYLYYFDPHFKADRYVEKLMFDKSGRLEKLDRHYIKHTAFKNIPAFKALNSKPEYSVTYFYDDRGRLVKDSCDYDYVVVRKYFYSDRLDSMLYTRTDRARFFEKQKTYYGADELRKSTSVTVVDRHFDRGKNTEGTEYSYTIAYHYRKW